MSTRIERSRTRFDAKLWFGRKLFELFGKQNCNKLRLNRWASIRFWWARSPLTASTCARTPYVREQLSNYKSPFRSNGKVLFDNIAAGMVKRLTASVYINGCVWIVAEKSQNPNNPPFIVDAVVPDIKSQKCVYRHPLDGLKRLRAI